MKLGSARIDRRDFVRALGLGAASACIASRTRAGGAHGAPAESFSEEEVAGGPDDFLVARHVQVRGTQREIGRCLAEIARSRHAVKPVPLDPFVLRARHEWYRRNWPALWERALGAADAYELDLERTDLDVVSLMINIVLSAPQCSTVYYPPASTSSNHALLSRNYDFSTGTFAEVMKLPGTADARPMTGDPYIIESHPDRGYPSLVISAYSPLAGCSDGVNSEGLTVALLSDNEIWNDPRAMEPTSAAQAGLNEGEVPRFLLDMCANVDEAKVALHGAKQYYRGAPCHYIVGDRSGRSFVWEHSRSHNREYVTDGGGVPQLLTNHPLFRYDSADKMPADRDPLGTYSRYRTLRAEIARSSGRLSIDDVKRVNSCVSIVDAPGTPKPKSPERTLWHAVYDCAERTLEVDFYLGEDPGSPDRQQRRSGYLRFELG